MFVKLKLKLYNIILLLAYHMLCFVFVSLICDDRVNLHESR